MCISADLTHVLIVYKNRKDHVALADQHRGTEICQASHKYHNGACRNGRSHNRQSDCQKAAQLIASQIFRCLLNTGIDASHGTRRIQVHIREQFKRKYQDDPQFPVYTRKMDPDLRKHTGDKSRAAKQHDPAVSTDERRAHQTHDNEDMNKVLTEYIVAGHDVSDRHAHKKCGTGRHDRHKQASSQCRIVILFRKEPDVVLKSKPGCLI